MTVQTLENTPVSSQVAVDALLGEVGFWTGVEVGEHRFGGQAFHLGRRELGHVHALPGRCFADIPLPRGVRDELVAAGRGQPHHVLPDSGWLTVPIETVADLRNAVEIFRLSYDRASRKNTV
jgi:luciferase-like monooxygenase